MQTFLKHFLAVVDLLRCRLVCQHWKNLSNLEFLWEELLEHDFDLTKEVKNSLTIVKKEQDISWQQQYKTFYGFDPRGEWFQTSFSMVPTTTKIKIMFQ